MPQYILSSKNPSSAPECQLHNHAITLLIILEYKEKAVHMDGFHLMGNSRNQSVFTYTFSQDIL